MSFLGVVLTIAILSTFYTDLVGESSSTAEEIICDG